MTDIGADAVKTGMLFSSEIIEAVVAKIAEHGLAPLVVDPVMVSKSGDRLLRDQAVDALRTTLLPLATVVTPNAPEAEVLTGRTISTLDDARRAARELVDELGAGAAVVKGGHLEGPATDVLYQAGEFIEFKQPRLNTKNTHGTGCTFASATAAGLAKGWSVAASVGVAKEYVTLAIRAAFPMGGGHGPLNHFYQLWSESVD